MWDVVTPITVGDQHVGYVFAGQFFFEDEPVDYELFRFQARQYGFNEEEYIAALEKVPRLSREAVNTGMAFFMTFANMISQLSYSNIKLVQSLVERDDLVQALRDSEKRERARSDELEAVLDAVPAAVWITHDPQALQLTGNRLSYEWLRLPKGANASKFAPEGERPETYTMFKDGVEIPLADMPVRMSAKGIDVHDYEFDLVYPDGAVRHLLGNARPLLDEKDKPRGAVSAFIDITEIKEAEEALKKAYDSLEVKVRERTAELKKAYNSLKESETGLAEAQKMAHIGNWRWDIAPGELFWSDEVYHIFGLNPQKSRVTYDLFLSCVHPDDRDYLINAINEGLNGNPSAVEYRIILPDGEERIVHTESEVISYEENNPIQAKGIVQDITERKKREEELRKNEEKYRNIVETANEGIGIIDIRGIVTFANKKLWDMLGYNVEEGYNKSAYELVDDAAQFKKTLEERCKGICDNYELKTVRKDGSKLWVLASVKPLFNEKGEYTGSLGMFTDITKRKEAEEILASIEIARKKEIHHRIKNNLQVISSLLDLQAEKFGNREFIMNSEVMEAFRESQDRVISMALIHEELHKSEGLDTLNFSPYIEELAGNLFQTYRLGNANISLNMDLEENIFFDMDTAVPLGIIINELVSNSLKHAFSGRDNGEIRIKLHREGKGECKNEGCRSDSFTLTVSDNGIGMPEDLDIEDLDTLGFQLVISLVDQLDGEFELKRNNGTEFTIRFTVAEKGDQASNPARIE